MPDPLLCQNTLGIDLGLAGLTVGVLLGLPEAVQEKIRLCGCNKCSVMEGFKSTRTIKQRHNSHPLSKDVQNTIFGSKLDIRMKGRHCRCGQSYQN